MNTSKRFLMGLISSLLIMVGLTRAGERCDPLTGSVGKNAPAGKVGARIPCSIPCWED